MALGIEDKTDKEQDGIELQPPNDDVSTAYIIIRNINYSSYGERDT